MHLKLLLLFAFISTCADAANLEVSPTFIDVVAPAGAGALTLTNVGDVPARAQVRVFRWRQEKGEDILTATDAVVVSPPALALASRQPYTIRVIHRGEAPRFEEAYRLLVDELPDPTRGAEAGRVTVAIRLNLPVFFSPAAVAPEKLLFRIEGGSLVVQNDGGRRARLSDIKLQPQGGKPILLVKGLGGYALPGSAKKISLPHAIDKNMRGSVIVVTDRGPINAPLAARP